MSLVERLRSDVGSLDPTFPLTFDEHVVSSIGYDSETGTSQERYKAWRESQAGARPTEDLLPRVVRRIEGAWAPFMRRGPPGGGPRAARPRPPPPGPRDG